MSTKDGPDLVEDALGYVTEYAKSNRSTCQVCKEKIEKGIVRLGVEVPNPYKEGSTMPLWGHPTCIFARLKKPGKPGKAQKLTSVDDIKGYDDLEKKDQNDLKKLVEAHAEAVLGNVPQESDWTELVNDDNYFWKIARVGTVTHTSYGNQDQRDQALTMVKEHADETAALAYEEKMILEKKKKGYHEPTDEEETKVKAEPKEEEEPAKKKAKPAADGAAAAVKKEETKEETQETDVLGFQVEYAKSNRSRCKGCNEKIDKGELRMAKVIDNPYVPRKDPDTPVKMPVWYHVECFWSNQRKGTSKKTRLQSSDELEGLDALKQSDKTAVIERIEKEVEALQAFATAPPAASSSTATPADQVYLEATTGEHNKWWGITQNGSKTKTRWGEIGDTEGNFVLKEFDTEDKATAYFKKMVTSKLAKCEYELIGLAGVPVPKEDREERAAEFKPEPKQKKSPAKKSPTPKKRKRT